MIEETFSFIRSELNNYLNVKLNSPIKDRVVLGDITDNDKLDNKIIL